MPTPVACIHAHCLCKKGIQARAAASSGTMLLAAAQQSAAAFAWRRSRLHASLQQGRTLWHERCVRPSVCVPPPSQHYPPPLAGRGEECVNRRAHRQRDVWLCGSCRQPGMRLRASLRCRHSMVGGLLWGKGVKTKTTIQGSAASQNTPRCRQCRSVPPTEAGERRRTAAARRTGGREESDQRALQVRCRAGQSQTLGEPSSSSCGRCKGGRRPRAQCRAAGAAAS